MTYRIAPEITNNRVGWLRIGKLEIYWHKGNLQVRDSQNNRTVKVNSIELESIIFKFVKENYEV